MRRLTPTIIVLTRKYMLKCTWKFQNPLDFYTENPWISWLREISCCANQDCSHQNDRAARMLMPLYGKTLMGIHVLYHMHQCDRVQL